MKTLVPLHDLHIIRIIIIALFYLNREQGLSILVCYNQSFIWFVKGSEHSVAGRKLVVEKFV